MTAAELSRQPIKRVGGSGQSGRPIVVFAHANGYPPEAYASLFASISDVAEIWAVEHRPFWTADAAPSRLKWQHYADDLLQTVAARFSQPVWLVGHSMGAVASMMAASREPARFMGLIAIDPVLLIDQLWWPAQVFGRLRPNALPMVSRALARPHHFASASEAFSFYRGKRVFARVGDKELLDYVRAGHADNGSGGVTLRWSGAWEACVYRSVPRMWGLLERLKLPTMGLIGDQSDVLDARAIARWSRAQPHAELLSLDGGHLLPLEDPATCGLHVSEFINRSRVSVASA